MHIFLRILAISFLTAAILWGCTPLATSLNPVRMSITSQATQTTTVQAAVKLTEVMEYQPSVPVQARTGVCLAHSARVPRTNVWQCTVDDTTYDPCFTVGAEQTIVCSENLLDSTSSFRIDLTAPLPVQPTTTSNLSLNLDDLKSLWYFGLDAVDGAVVLTNGEYQTIDATDKGASTAMVVRLSELKTEGDLDLDGDADAASVLIASSSDIFTRYYLVAITNENGQAVNSATIPLGDGIRVDNLAIENGQIVVDITTHGAQDPLCCPTSAETRFYSLESNQLKMYTGAWQLELSDGILCTLTTKSSASNTFQCADGRPLLAPLQPGAVWTAIRPHIDPPNTFSTVDVETVSIRRLWQ